MSETEIAELKKDIEEIKVKLKEVDTNAKIGAILGIILFVVIIFMALILFNPA